ncbi:transcription termination/antitermination protein NusG [Botrimarina hoheduenensis]|uniref:transcription termination/antitermination protein NusG n=1 Tax=Botrimarina hoheduenensis TaxID=2528000 RepID=UPI0018D3E109|nr:transcription termination/antitermination protein NusG [Botrimarina hoheduenensis]
MNEEVEQSDSQVEASATSDEQSAAPVASDATVESRAGVSKPIAHEPGADGHAADDSQVDESQADELAEAEGDDGEDDDAGADEPAAVAPIGPIEDLSDEAEEEVDLQWYILKVQSNRERTSSEALRRKVAIEGLERFFGEIVVPTEKVTEFKNGKKKIVERKIWPGYIAAQMHFNEATWFAIRETSGIGDFTGASGKPMPMQPHEVAMILPKEEGEQSEDDTPKLNIKFAEGDKVKVKDGNFENFEGDVDSIDQQSGKITVMISIFGRSTPVELEYWQVETL